MKLDPHFAAVTSCSAWRAALAVTPVLWASVATAAQVPPRVDRQLSRPAAHSFLGTQPNPTTSFAERSVSLPEAGQVEFDYFVDSEAGHDFLRVSVGSATVFEESGRNRGGHARVPLAAGNHVLRFAYVKDTAGDVGRDVAWVDRIRISTNSVGTQRNEFDEALLDTPSGYTSGGFAGGFTVAERAARRGIRRSREAAFTGYDPTGTRAAMERTITWPSGSGRNELVLTYLVDSELDHDFFRVFVDGVEKFAVSGRERSDRVNVDVGAPGPHVIRFEYAKDESVDEGYDDAMVLELEARAGGNAFEVGGFDGQENGAAPDGWQVSTGADAGWVIGAGVSPRLYAAPQLLAAEPSVDGVREAVYGPSTRFALRDSGSVTGERGEGELLFDTDPSTLFLILRAEGRTAELGNEEGEFTILVDADHFNTLSGGSCDPDDFLPNEGDRRLRITYEAGSGDAEAEVSIEQDRGTCSSSAPWQAVTGSEAWPASAAVLEPELDLGFVLLELRIELENTPDIAADGFFGLGFSLSSASGVTYLLPGHDGAEPVANDVATWESIYLSNTSQKRPRAPHVLFDGIPRQ